MLLIVALRPQLLGHEAQGALARLFPAIAPRWTPANLDGQA
jgi:hypothetical protein